MPPDVTSVPLIDTLIEDEQWHPQILSFDVNKLAELCFTSVMTMLERHGLGEELTMVLSNDQHVQELNRTYRHKNKPTNVLSFPAAPVPGLPPEAQSCHLGDIVLAYETLAAEALAADISLHDHTAHLMIHGILHLLGYDHHTETEAAEMEQLEISLLARLKISNPYDTTNATS